MSNFENSDTKISDPNSDIAFGSLIRCSVFRLDKGATATAGGVIAHTQRSRNAGFNIVSGLKIRSWTNQAVVKDFSHASAP
ncbi:hypothetical protein HNR39_003729 [Glaciimonas immobilis]|uniref:Uncharacterized protein n=1 Tax=Glaciimonas immobilis TaxID=728004 RepID=A0A840RTJ9_9BURK|nr:hypothetical protein [Glaciimonas immobilis]